MIILASASPRRRALLEQIGIRIEQDAATIDETPKRAESAEQLVARLAHAKANAVASRRPDATILAADTVVVSDIGEPAETMGKPSDSTDNIAMLGRLSDSVHRVLTGFCILRGGSDWTRMVETQVTFRSIERGEIERYVATGEGLDKAGGYAIQGIGGGFVRAIDGSYSNVVGLPLAEVIEELRDRVGYRWP